MVAGQLQWGLPGLMCRTFIVFCFTDSISTPSPEIAGCRDKKGGLNWSGRSKIRLRLHLSFAVLRPFLRPGVEHKDIPEKVLPVPLSGLVLVPLLYDGLAMQEAVLLESRFRQQVVRPFV